MKKTNLTENVISSRLQAIYTKQDFLVLVKKILVIALFLFLVFRYIFTFHVVVGDSMSPNVKNSDLTVIYKIDQKYRQGDVVLISKNGTSYIVRVIGMPGDTILFNEKGEVILNNEKYEEDYIFEKTYADNDTNTYPLKLNSNEYFLLGDNRTTSKDSRDFGVVSIDEIKGKVIYVFRNREI